MKPPQKWWALKILGRYLVLAILAIPSGVIFNLVPSTPAWRNFVFKKALSFTLFGFFSAGLLDYLCQKFSCLMKEKVA
jgi:hypothetical protein